MLASQVNDEVNGQTWLANGESLVLGAASRQWLSCIVSPVYPYFTMGLKFVK